MGLAGLGLVLNLMKELVRFVLIFKFFFLTCAVKL